MYICIGEGVDINERGKGAFQAWEMVWCSNEVQIHLFGLGKMVKRKGKMRTWRGKMAALYILLEAGIDTGLTH